MRCGLCPRRAGGFRATDTRYRPGDRRRYPATWVFCSRACLERFLILSGGVRMRSGELTPAAERAALKAFGCAAERIGFDKPLGAYSEAEARAVIAAIVGAYAETLGTPPPAPADSGLPFDDDIPF